MSTDRWLALSPSVRNALARKSPVVALESSVFAQGLPIPENGDAAATAWEDGLRLTPTLPGVAVGVNGTTVDAWVAVGHGPTHGVAV